MLLDESYVSLIWNGLDTHPPVVASPTIQISLHNSLIRVNFTFISCISTWISYSPIFSTLHLLSGTPERTRVQSPSPAGVPFSEGIKYAMLKFQLKFCSRGNLSSPGLRKPFQVLTEPSSFASNSGIVLSSHPLEVASPRIHNCGLRALTL